MPRVHVLALLLAAAVLAGAGCYTVLRHPNTYDLADESQEQKSCADCHADADLYHYTDAHGWGWYNYYPAPWAVYYQSPWWYEDYWYYTPNSGDPGSPAVTDERNLWGRSPGVESDFLPSQGKQKIDSPLPSNTEKPDATPTGNEAKEDSKKKKKRTLWGR